MWVSEQRGEARSLYLAAKSTKQSHRHVALPLQGAATIRKACSRRWHLIVGDAQRVSPLSVTAKQCYASFNYTLFRHVRVAKSSPRCTERSCWWIRASYPRHELGFPPSFANQQSVGGRLLWSCQSPLACISRSSMRISRRCEEARVFGSQCAARKDPEIQRLGCSLSLLVMDVLNVQRAIGIECVGRNLCLSVGHRGLQSSLDAPTSVANSVNLNSHVTKQPSKFHKDRKGHSLHATPAHERKYMTYLTDKFAYTLLDPAAQVRHIFQICLELSPSGRNQQSGQLGRQASKVGIINPRKKEYTMYMICRFLPLNQ